MVEKQRKKWDQIPGWLKGVLVFEAIVTVVPAVTWALRKVRSGRMANAEKEQLRQHLGEQARRPDRLDRDS